MKVNPPLPDYYDPSVHDHIDSDSMTVRRHAQNMYRSRRYAANVTVRDHAKNNLRNRLFGRKQPETFILDADFTSAELYSSISQGPFCANLRRGKIASWVWGQKSHVFSIAELLDEIKLEKSQQKLF